MRHERVPPEAQTGALPFENGAHPSFEDICADLDAGTKLPWFCAHVGNDLSKTGLVEIACAHAAANPGFPSDETRLRRVGLPPKGSAENFFGFLEAMGPSAKGWASLRDQLARRIDDLMAGRALAAEAPRAPAPAQTLTARAAPPPRAPEPEPEPEPPSIWREQAGASAADQAAGPEVPASPIPGCLPPPPPEGASKSTLVSWLSGRVWHPDAVGLTLDESELDFDDLTDLERDIAGAATAERFFARPDVRPRQDPDSAKREAEWLRNRPAARMGPDVSPRDATRALVEALTEVLERQDLKSGAHMAWTKGASTSPEALALRKSGAIFTPGPGAIKVAAAALEIEAVLLRDEPPGGKPAPIFAAPGHDWHVGPGWMLRRAAFDHMTGGVPLARALFDALLDLRVHQVVKTLGYDGLAYMDDCEKRFYADFQAPLTAYQNVTVELEACPEP